MVNVTLAQQYQAQRQKKLEEISLRNESQRLNQELVKSNFGGSVQEFNKFYSNLQRTNPSLAKRISYNPQTVKVELNNRITIVKSKLDKAQKKSTKYYERDNRVKGKQYREESRGYQEALNRLNKGELLSIKEIDRYADALGDAARDKERAKAKAKTMTPKTTKGKTLYTINIGGKKYSSTNKKWLEEKAKELTAKTKVYTTTLKKDPKTGEYKTVKKLVQTRADFEIQQTELKTTADVERFIAKPKLTYREIIAAGYSNEAANEILKIKEKYENEKAATLKKLKEAEKKELAFDYLRNKLLQENQKTNVTKSIWEKNTELLKRFFKERKRIWDKNARLVEKKINVLTQNEFVKAYIATAKADYNWLKNKGIKLSETKFVKAYIDTAKKDYNLLKKTASQVKTKIDVKVTNFAKEYVKTAKKDYKLLQDTITDIKNSKFAKEYVKTAKKDYELLKRKVNELTQSQFVKEYIKTAKKDYEWFKQAGVKISQSEFVKAYIKTAKKDYKLLSEGISKVKQSKFYKDRIKTIKKNISLITNSRALKYLKEQGRLNLIYAKSQLNKGVPTQTELTRMLKKYQDFLINEPTGLSKADQESKRRTYLNKLEKENDIKLDEGIKAALVGGFLVGTAQILRDPLKYKAEEDVQDAIDLINAPIATLSATAAYIAKNPARYGGEILAEIVWLGAMEDFVKKTFSKSKTFLSEVKKGFIKSYGGKKAVTKIGGKFVPYYGQVSFVTDTYKIFRAAYIATIPIKRGESKKEYNARIDLMTINKINKTNLKKAFGIKETKYNKQIIAKLNANIKALKDKNKAKLKKIDADIKKQKQKLKQTKKDIKQKAKLKTTKSKLEVKTKEKKVQKQKLDIKQKQKQKQKLKEKQKMKIKEKQKQKQKLKQKIKEKQKLKQKLKQKQKTKAKLKLITKKKEDKKEYRNKNVYDIKYKVGSRTITKKLDLPINKALKYAKQLNKKEVSIIKVDKKKIKDIFRPQLQGFTVKTLKTQLKLVKK